MRLLLLGRCRDIWQGCLPKWHSVDGFQDFVNLKALIIGLHLLYVIIIAMTCKRSVHCIGWDMQMQSSLQESENEYFKKMKNANKVKVINLDDMDGVIS